MVVRRTQMVNWMEIRTAMTMETHSVTVNSMASQTETRSATANWKAMANY